MGNYCRQKQQRELGRVLTPHVRFIASSFASCQPAHALAATMISNGVRVGWLRATPDA
jgi:hypothetical protein